MSVIDVLLISVKKYPERSSRIKQMLLAENNKLIPLHKIKKRVQLLAPPIYYPVKKI